MTKIGTWRIITNLQYVLKLRYKLFEYKKSTIIVITGMMKIFSMRTKLKLTTNSKAMATSLHTQTLVSKTLLWPQAYYFKKILWCFSLHPSSSSWNTSFIAWNFLTLHTYQVHRLPGGGFPLSLLKTGDFKNSKFPTHFHHLGQLITIKMLMKLLLIFNHEE